MCTPASTALFAWHCVQVRYRHIRQAAIPARVVLGTGRFLRPIKSVPRLRIPVLCDAHARLFRVTSVFTKFNRLPSLIISAILAQYSSLCDHLVLQFNLG